MSNQSAARPAWEKGLRAPRAPAGGGLPRSTFHVLAAAIMCLCAFGTAGAEEAAPSAARSDAAWTETIHDVAASQHPPHPPADVDDADPPAAWRLGENLAVGDSYTYRVCGSVYTGQAAHPDPCHTLRMDFVYRMVHHAYGPVWIVDVRADPGGRTVMILEYDTMIVHPTSAWDVRLAGFIQDTILHLAPYGEQGLGVGAYWGEIDAYFYSVPLSVVSRAGDKSVLGYDTTAESRTVIVPGMPFPEYSRWHDPRSISADPRIMHEYALVR